MALATVERLSVTYRGATARALRDVSLRIDEGESIALLGLSGAGKSTLLRALAGLVPHFHGGRFEGRVCVGGLDTREARPAELVGRAAIVFQDPEDQVVMTRVLREVAFGLENVGVPSQLLQQRVEEALEAVGALPLRDRRVMELSSGELQRVCLASALALRPELLLLDEPTSQLEAVGALHLRDRRVMELSCGELQRVCLASALALRPELLLLDEPTSQLDADGAAAFLDAVAAAGCAVVLSEQRIARALGATDRVLALEDGRVVFDGDRGAAEEWLARETAGLGARPLAEPLAAPRDDTVVELTDVGFAYADRTVVDGLDLTVRAGEIVALEGPNGCGKTTIGKLAAGLLEPSSGRVERGGRAGYLSQDPGRYLVRDRVVDEVGLGVGGQEDRARAALRSVGLEWAAERHPRDLSSGERERLGIAAVAVGSPDLLVLDEPTRGVDPLRKREIEALVREHAARGAGVIVATHDLDFVAHRRVALPRLELAYA